MHPGYSRRPILRPSCDRFLVRTHKANILNVSPSEGKLCSHVVTVRLREWRVLDCELQGLLGFELLDFELPGLQLLVSGLCVHVSNGPIYRRRIQCPPKPKPTILSPRPLEIIEFCFDLEGSWCQVCGFRLGWALHSPSIYRPIFGLHNGLFLFAFLRHPPYEWPTP